MREICIPYGKTVLTGHVEEKNFLGSFHAALPEAARDEAAEVSGALDAPFASPGLEELASRVKDAVIIASDHTRPVPSRILMPQILARLRKGNPSIAITILIATGFHRATTEAELLDKFGPEIVRRERIVVHDSSDESGLVRIGTLPSGGDLIVNRLAAEASLLVAEGFIEPHFFAGFSGGRKSVLPGIASRRTVLANHCAEFISHPKARTGTLDGNPIHEDMLFAAKAAKLAFIVNVVINAEKRIVAAFAGDPVAAHRAGTEYLSRHARIEVPEADIVVTGNGGYRNDSPCSLTSDRQPILVLVRNGPHVLSLMRPVTDSPNTAHSNYGRNTTAWTENGVSWYNTENAGYQMNNSGQEYHYLAILV